MNNDLEKALYGAKARCEGNIVSDVARMMGFEKIYPFTTENIAGYIDFFDLKDKPLLTVGSSGDQIINAAIRGTKDVTSLDINPYTRYYYYLKAAGILELNLTEFYEFFIYHSSFRGSIINRETFNNASYKKLKNTLQGLDNDSYLFWNELFDTYSPATVRCNLFSNDEYPISLLKEIDLYLQSENNYSEVKDKIKKLRPEFINANVLKTNLDDKFDNIWPSNISCYLQRNEMKKVTNKFLHSLNDDGQLLISYLYSDCMYTSHNLKNNLELLKKYSPSFYSFKGMGGMRYNDDDIKDVVLIYQKKTI